MTYLGELAALGTACCWTFGSFFFDAAGRTIGPLSVNKIRIPMAAALLATALLVTTGHPFPTAISMMSLIWLTLSGLVGLVLGDFCFFTSLVILGPRRATLILSSAPVLTALAAWPILDEKLGVWAITGIIVTMGGILWVSIERRRGEHLVRTGSLTAGFLWGLGGATGQAIGLVLAKLGMGDDLSALEGTFCRMAAASVLIWLPTLFIPAAWAKMHSMRNRRGILFSFAGAFVGPFVGVWLSLVAVKHTAAGVAATIMAIVPVLVIPLAVILHHERPSIRAIIGSIIAVGGVVILFLR
jgi:drug/metabolite transporter (DMT)-like permease